MNLFSFAFVFVILAVSGAIAYAADRLGKKLGKKRLSVFGLRPKHVATLGTVIMGVVLSGFTIGAVALSSRDAGTWLAKGRQLVVEVTNLERKNDEAARVNQRLSLEGDRLRTTNEGLGKQNAGLQAAVTRLQNSLVKEQIALSQGHVALDALKEQQLRLVTQRDRLSSQVSSLKGLVLGARLQLANANRLLASAKERLFQAKTSLVNAQNELRTTEKNANFYHNDAEQAKKVSQETYQQNKILEAEVADRQIQVDDLKNQRDALIDARNAAAKDLTEAQSRYAQVQTQLEQASKDLADQQNQLLFLAGTTRASRTEPMTFRKGEELARVVVPGGSDPVTTSNLLTSLIREARIQAVARGAKAHRNGGETYEAADIVERKDPKTGAILDAETLKRALVSAVEKNSGDQVLVASSTLNAFAGEPVSLDIAVLSNPLVYRRSELVAETQIDGSQPVGRIVAALNDFVVSRVRDRAVRDRMIPRIGAAAPFGELTTTEVYNLVQDVKQRGRPVRVQAFADSDTRAADPLRLEFRIR